VGLVTPKNPQGALFLSTPFVLFALAALLAMWGRVWWGVKLVDSATPPGPGVIEIAVKRSITAKRALGGLALLVLVAAIVAAGYVVVLAYAT
jgi:hypothetical protein